MGTDLREVAKSAYYCGGGYGGVGLDIGSGVLIAEYPIAASYPPLRNISQPETMTATEVAQAQEDNFRDWISVLEARPIRPTGQRSEAFEPYGELELKRAYATIRAKEDIISGLRDEMNFLRAREAATEAAEGRALDRAEQFKAERDRLIGENEANKAIAAERLIEIDLRNTGLSLLTEANAELKQQVARLEAQLGEAKLGGKPNTHNTSRLGHFGEAQTKQGLALYDRYY